jgi:hypothetical protein
VPRVGRRLLAAGLGLAASLGGCGGSGDEVPSLRTVPPSETTTAAPEPTPTTAAPEVPAATPTTARPGTGGGGSGGAAPGPAAAPAGSVALAPAPPGTYRYDTSGTTTVGLTVLPYPAVTTLTVDPPAGSRQHWTRDLRDPSGNGPVLELSLDYRPGGVHLEGLRLTTSISGFVDTRDLRPPSPALLLPTGAGPGARQEIDLAGGASSARLVVEVQGQERLTIGGRAVDTLVVHLVATLAPGQITGTLDLTAWLAPSVRLWVKERSVTDATAGGGLARLQSRYEATLQRLP